MNLPMVEFVRFVQNVFRAALLFDVHVLVFQVFRGLGLEYDMSGLT